MKTKKIKAWAIVWKTDRALGALSGKVYQIELEKPKGFPRSNVYLIPCEIIIKIKK